MDEDELKKLKEQRKEQLDGEGGGMEQQQEAIRQQLKQIASQILTEDARSRLGNIRAAKPDLASQIEFQLVQLHRAGQIKDKITDDQLKELLKKIRDSEDEPDIKYSTR